MEIEGPWYEGLGRRCWRGSERRIYIWKRIMQGGGVIRERKSEHRSVGRSVCRSKPGVLGRSRTAVNDLTFLRYTSTPLVHFLRLASVRFVSLCRRYFNLPNASSSLLLLFSSFLLFFHHNHTHTHIKYIYTNVYIYNLY